MYNKPVVYFTDEAVKQLMNIFNQEKVEKPAIRLEADKQVDGILHEFHDIDYSEISECSDANPSGDIVFKLNDQILVAIRVGLLPLYRGIVIDFKEDLETPTFTFFKQQVVTNEGK